MISFDVPITLLSAWLIVSSLVRPLILHGVLSTSNQSLMFLAKDPLNPPKLQ